MRFADRLGEDLVGGLDPGERGRAGVPFAGEALDRGGEEADVFEAAAPEGLAGQDAEPGLDLVHPGRAGGREVEREAGVLRQPRMDVGGLVGAYVVEDDVDLAPAIGTGEQPQERQEVVTRVSLTGLVRHLPGRDLERSEQAERPVALVVVRVPLHLPGPEREHGLGPVERLDLGLLVDREDDRPLGRREVEPNDIGDLGRELGVAAVLERLDPVRLETPFRPHAADGGRAHPDLPREPCPAPVGHRLRPGQRGREDLLPDLAPVRPGTAGVGRVGQPREPLLLEPAPPQQHGLDADAELIGNLDMGGPLGRAEDDPGAHHSALLGRARPGHRAEGFSFGLANSQRRRGMSSHVPDTTSHRFKNQAHCGVRH